MANAGSSYAESPRMNVGQGAYKVCSHTSPILSQPKEQYRGLALELIFTCFLCQRKFLELRFRVGKLAVLGLECAASEFSKPMVVR